MPFNYMKIAVPEKPQDEHFRAAPQPAPDARTKFLWKKVRDAVKDMIARKSKQESLMEYSSDSGAIDH